MRRGFFQTFFTEYSYEEWIAVFDWLFDDNKYLGWSSSDLRYFVLDYKELDVIKNGLYICDKRSAVKPEDYNRKKNRKKRSIIVMIKGSGEAKDIVRHIRNGVAHGRAALCTRNGVRCFEIIDFGKYGEKSEKGGQTAYMLIPVDFVYSLFSIYCRRNPANKDMPRKAK